MFLSVCSSPLPRSSPPAAKPAPPPPPPVVHQPPPQAVFVPVQQGRQPGMFAQMASTAAGVAVGSTVGHVVGHALFGGRGGNDQPAQQPAAPVQVCPSFWNHIASVLTTYDNERMNDAISCCLLNLREMVL